MHKQIRASIKPLHRWAEGSATGCLGSARALRLADGVKSHAEVRQPQSEAGENHQEHDPIDDAHAQRHCGQGQLKAGAESFGSPLGTRAALGARAASGALGADCVFADWAFIECVCERFNALLIIE
jgi:hypothetical protein